MSLKAYRLMSDWRLIEVKDLGILYLEGIVDSKLVRSERLTGLSFDRREASDFHTIYELGSVNKDFAHRLEAEGLLFSDYNFTDRKK